MLFFIPNLQASAFEPIVRAMKARDPKALVVGVPNANGIRIVGRLTLRHMLSAFAEAGVDAVPEFQIANPGKADLA